MSVNTLTDQWIEYISASGYKQSLNNPQSFVVNRYCIIAYRITVDLNVYFTIWSAHDSVQSFKKHARWPHRSSAQRAGSCKSHTTSVANEASVLKRMRVLAEYGQDDDIDLSCNIINTARVSCDNRYVFVYLYIIVPLSCPWITLYHIRSGVLL